MVMETQAESLTQAIHEDAERLSGEDLAAHELTLQRLDAQLLAAKFRAAEAVAVRSMTVTEGYRRPQQWVIFETRQSQRFVNREFRLAETLVNRLPSVLAALEAAEIYRCHIDTFMKLADRKELAEALERDVDELLALAKSRPFIEFETLAEAWAIMVDPTDPQDIDERAHDNRHLVWTDSIDGETLVELRVPSINWDHVIQGLEKIVKQMFNDDWQHAKDIHGPDTLPEHLPRTEAQRRADALLLMLRKGMKAEGDDPGAETVVNVVVDEQTLDDETKRQAEQTVRPRTVADLSNYRCETSTGLKLTASQALLLSLGSQIRRVVLGAPTLEMSSKQRLFTGNLREAILMKHRWCENPGCETRSNQCQIDHVIPAARGGPTNAQNGRPRCNPCHRHKTRLENLGLL